MAAALYPPAFVQALLSTPIRAERHGDEGGGLTWHRWTGCTCTRVRMSRTQQGSGTVGTDGLLWVDGSSLVKESASAAAGYLDTAAGILRGSGWAASHPCWLFSAVFNTHIYRILRPCRVGVHVKCSSADHWGGRRGHTERRTRSIHSLKQRNTIRLYILSFSGVFDREHKHCTSEEFKCSINFGSRPWWCGTSLLPAWFISFCSFVGRFE